MKCFISVFMVCATLLFIFILPIEVNGCSTNTYDIISLMSSDPDFRRNPCYIQWQAEQDAKLKQLWKQRAELEESIARNDRIRALNRQREDEARRNSYTNRVEKKKESSIWKILGIIVGVMVGICCCAACVSCAQSEDDTTAVPATTTLNLGELTAVSTANANSNNINLIGSDRRPYSREPNVPLLPRDVINRQNSLPSYDDAVKMPSAPRLD